jgi:2,4-dienoyl-CoA reductase-like NADH-dependent reductase (Old Yellow Enzyme family)
VAAGFRGIQVHAAHGYLLSQFLSAATNRRDDRYGGDLAGRARLLLEIVQTCRDQLDDHVSVWVKVNSNDFRTGGLAEDEAAQVVGWLDELGVDVVEVSGGTYESLRFLDDEPVGSAAYFLDFARAVQRDVEVPLLLTGGFHETTGMVEARRDGIELIGLARPLAADPDLARRLLDGTTQRAARPAPSLPDALPGGLAETSRVGWYRARMELAARGLPAVSPPAPIAAADYALREVVTALGDLPRRRRRIRELS